MGGDKGQWPASKDIKQRRAGDDAQGLSSPFVLLYFCCWCLIHSFLQITREVLDIAAKHVKPGVTTDEIDEIVHKATLERNAYPSPLGYRGFPKSVCT